MIKKVHVKKGDTVVIISGKDKDKKGKVLQVLPKEGKVIVEGANMATKHKKPSKEVQQGGIIHQEAPMYSSKVALYCPNCNEGRRTRHEFLADGKKIRKCVKCGEVIETQK